MNNDLQQYAGNSFTDLDLEGMAHGNNPVANAYRELLKFRRTAGQAKPTFAEWLSSLDGTIEVDCGCVTTEAFYHWLKVAYESTPQPAHTEQMNSPVIPYGWIKCSERMPKVGDVVLTAHQGATNIGEMERSGRDYRYFTSIASGRELPADFWMPLPAAPKPEM